MFEGQGWHLSNICPNNIWPLPLLSHWIQQHCLSDCAYTPCQNGVYQSITWNSFFPSLFTEADCPLGTVCLVIPRKCPSSQTLKFVASAAHWAGGFSHGNCWASSGKHLQSLNGQLQAGEFKRQPNRVLMPWKMIIKDIYGKKKPSS